MENQLEKFLGLAPKSCSFCGKDAKLTGCGLQWGRSRFFYVCKRGHRMALHDRDGRIMERVIGLA